MHSRPTLIAALSLAGALGAQNDFELYPNPGSTTGTTRLGPGWTAGELLMQVHPKVFRGIGNNGKYGQITDLFAWIEDKNAQTVDSLRLILRRDDGSGRPLGGAAGIIWQSPPIPTPGGPLGPRSWMFKASVGKKPIQVPCTGFLYVGVALGPNPGWPLDGLYVHMAAYPPPGMIGDNPRPGTPNYSWRLDGATASQPIACTLRVGARTPAPVLNAGAVIPGAPRGPNPNFGAAGAYPWIARGDSLVFRIRDTGPRAGLLMVAPAFASFGLPILRGNVKAWPPIFWIPFTVPAGGSVTVSDPLFNPIPAFLSGQKLVFQAFTQHGSVWHASNAQSVSF